MAATEELLAMALKAASGVVPLVVAAVREVREVRESRVALRAGGSRAAHPGTTGGMRIRGVLSHRLCSHTLVR